MRLLVKGATKRSVGRVFTLQVNFLVDDKAKDFILCFFFRDLDPAYHCPFCYAGLRCARYCLLQQ